MSYATGVASSIDDFLSQLVSFAVANAGFTNEGTVTSSAGSNSRTIRRISKGGIWWNLSPSSSGTVAVGLMGYSGLPAGYNLAGTAPAGFQPVFTTLGFWGFSAGPFVGHYFFSDGTCVHAVIEIASGIYNHISFGSVTKFGAWTGGEYLTAGSYQTYQPGGVWSDWNSTYCHRPFNDAPDGTQSISRSYLRTANTAAAADFTALLNSSTSWSAMFCGNDTGPSASSNASLYARLLRDLPSVATNRTALFPGLVRVYDSASGRRRIVGHVPYVAMTRFTADMNPKDLVNTDWQVFPITMRSGGDTTVAASSYDFALAYRRIT